MGNAPLERQPRRMREQVPDSRPRGPAGWSRSKHALLRRDQHRQRSHELRHRGPAEDRVAGPRGVAHDLALTEGRRPRSSPPASPSTCREHLQSRAGDTRRAMEQIFPPEIMGTGFAEGGSVRDHCFGRARRTRSESRRSTLLDGEMFDLVQHVEAVLAAIVGHELEERVGTGADAVGARDRDAGLPNAPPRWTPSCASCASYLAGLARDRGLRLGSAGMHPFSLFERQRITARDRYRHLVHQLQYIARAGRPSVCTSTWRLTFAIGGPGRQWAADAPLAVRSRSRELAVLARRADRLRVDGTWSSPPSRARSRCCASATTRTTPRSWSARGDRPHPGTTPTSRGHPAPPAPGRSRPGSAMPSRLIEDAVAIAAFCQSCQAHSRALRGRRGDPLVPPDPHYRDKWLAARYGLEAPVMDLATGRRNRVPVAQLLRRTLRDLEPHAREPGCERELEGITRDPRARATAPTASAAPATRAAT